MIIRSQIPVGQTIAFCGLSTVVCPEPGTGPGPVLFRAHQSRFDGIALDITDYFLQLLRRTYPVIVGFILPKRMSTAPQNPLGDPAGPALQPAHDSRHRDMWLPHCVHMVRHDRPGVKVVRVADCRAILESILDNLGDAGVLQPERPRTGSVEPLVSDAKRNAACILGREDLGCARWSGSGEAPSYKDNAAVREPMRKVPAIKKHLKMVPFGRPQKTMVCPTEKNLTTLEWKTP